MDEEEEVKGINRRTFLRRAALTGAAAAWAAPVVQTVMASPASAQQNATPFCGHSCGAVSGGPSGCNGGCKAACTLACGDTSADCSCSDTLGSQEGPGGACEAICGSACPPGQGGNNPCCNSGFCVVGNFDCERSNGQVTSLEYTGPVAGCPSGITITFP